MRADWKMPRQIAFDITHIVSRLAVERPSGIDKVDLAFADHFADAGCDVAVHYGLRAPRIHPGAVVGKLRAQARRQRWHDDDARDDATLDFVYAFLAGRAKKQASSMKSLIFPRDRWRRRWAQAGWRLAGGTANLPNGAIYLNAAQHAFEYPRFFSWLEQRPDVRPVFIVHDLLPLDYPEYFPPGYKERFGRRVTTILKYAAGLVVASSSVEKRLKRAFTEAGRPMPRCYVAPLPSSLPSPRKSISEHQLQSTPYFIAVGTIEPRKNHLLLLNIWRRLAEEHAHPPKLVIVGARGWENEQILDVLDRSVLVRPHVLELSGIGDRALAQLIAGSRALLMPSFAEGYGLPVVEGLALGTPVVASDIPVFREISQGEARFLHPLDGIGWRSAIETLSDADSATAREARVQAERFRAPNWNDYFAGLRNFCAEL